MARGRKSSVIVSLSVAQRQELEHWSRSTTMPAGEARRARMVLLRADGHSISEVARRVGVQRRVVYTWLRRFLATRLEGLHDKPGRGRKGFFSPGGSGPSGQTRLRKAG